MADIMEMIIDSKECCSNTPEEREELKEQGFTDYLLVDWEPTSMWYRGKTKKEYDPCAPASSILDYDLPLAGKMYVLFGNYTMYIILYGIGNAITSLDPSENFWQSLWTSFLIALFASLMGYVVLAGAATNAKVYKTAVEYDLWIDQMSEEEFIRVWSEKRSRWESCFGCYTVKYQIKIMGSTQRAAFGTAEEIQGFLQTAFSMYYKCVIAVATVAVPLMFVIAFLIQASTAGTFTGSTASFGDNMLTTFFSLLLVIVIGWIQALITKFIIYHLKVSCCKQSQDTVNDSLLDDDVSNSDTTSGYGSIGAAKV